MVWPYVGQRCHETLEAPVSGIPVLAEHFAVTFAANGHQIWMRTAWHAALCHGAWAEQLN